MKALIFNNKVVDVKETEFPVHNSLTWIDCGDEIKIGFSYDGSTFTSNERTAEEIQAKIDADAQKATNKASGNQKLLDLGLSQPEVDALTS
jgi:hypothetical protein